MHTNLARGRTSEPATWLTCVNGYLEFKEYRLNDASTFIGFSVSLTRILLETDLDGFSHKNGGRIIVPCMISCLLPTVRISEDGCVNSLTGPLVADYPDLEAAPTHRQRTSILSRME